MRQPCSQIAKEILRYLLKNPNAEDTLKGIAEWWLGRQGVKTAVEDVRAALAELVGKGLLIEKQGIAQEPRYRLNRSKLHEIRSALNMNDTDRERGC